MTTIYVATTGNDTTGNGSSGNPYATISKAGTVAVAGDLISVANGTYNLPAGGWEMAADGTGGAPITYKSAVKYGAKIVPPSSPSTNVPFWFRGDYSIIDGFEVDGTGISSGATGCYGIYATGEGSIVQNCHVHNIGTDAAGASAGIGTDGFYTGTHIDVLNCWVHDIGLASTNTIHCIYVSNQFGRCNGNLCYRAGGWGISLYHDANAVQIMNNTIFNCDSGAITVGGGGNYNLVGNCDNCMVANNIAFDCTTAANGYGIDEFGTTGPNNQYSHNLSFGNSTNWQLQNGLSDASAITANPSFINYVRTGGGDYHLAVGSPCRNAGILSLGGLSAPSVDIDGTPRPLGSAIDVGAFEFIEVAGAVVMNMRR